MYVCMYTVSVCVCVCVCVCVQGKKLPKELEENDDADGGDVSDEDEAADINTHDIETAREKGRSMLDTHMSVCACTHRRARAHTHTHSHSSRLTIVSREAKKKQHTRPLSELFTHSTGQTL